MLNEHTLDQLRALRLDGMVHALEDQVKDAQRLKRGPLVFGGGSRGSVPLFRSESGGLAVEGAVYKAEPWDNGNGAWPEYVGQEKKIVYLKRKVLNSIARDQIAYFILRSCAAICSKLPLKNLSERRQVGRNYK
jgi:hypothetical protein